MNILLLSFSFHLHSLIKCYSILCNAQSPHINTLGIALYNQNYVGLVLQFSNLMPTMIVTENVEFTLALTERAHLAGKAKQLLDLEG